MARKRYVIEGEWSGYRSSQRRVVHRAVTTRPQRYQGLKAIQFTDNTLLSITLRECEPRERVQEIKGYVNLIEDAADTGLAFVAVESLNYKPRIF